MFKTQHYVKEKKKVINYVKRLSLQNIEQSFTHLLKGDQYVLLEIGEGDEVIITL